MNGMEVLQRWNRLDPAAAADEVLPCCGSPVWAERLARLRPIASPALLIEAGANVWRALPAAEQEIAFQSHPRLGERTARAAEARSLAWSAEEQAEAQAGDATAAESLAAANARYEAKFGRTFLICASGRSVAEITAAMERRLQHAPEQERAEEIKQQEAITRLRLRRWLGAS